MQAVILAGGKGTRLRPLTEALPKPLIPVLNKPLMEYSVELLKKHGLTDIGVTVHFLPQKIREYFGNGERFGVHVTYFDEGERSLGTAGSVLPAKEQLDETFVVLCGDGLSDVDLSKVLIYHKAQKADATIVLKKSASPLSYGVVLTSSDGRILSFSEKPLWETVVSDTVNTGIYVLEKKVLDRIPPETEFDFSKDLFPLLLKENAALYGYITEDYWCDLGTGETYLKATRDLLNGAIVGGGKRNVTEAGFSISEDSRLVPPTCIGKNVSIRGKCVIGPYAVLGDGCQVTDATIENSVLWSGATLSGTDCRFSVIGQNSMIEETVMGGFNLVGNDISFKRGILKKHDHVPDAYGETPDKAARDVPSVMDGYWEDAAENVTEHVLRGLVTSLPGETVIVSYDHSPEAKAAATSAAGYASMAGKSVGLVYAGESAARFQCLINRSFGLYLEGLGGRVRVQTFRDDGKNLTSDEERSLDVHARRLRPETGSIKTLKKANANFAYFLNTALPAARSMIALEGAFPYPLHGLVFREIRDTAFVRARNGQVVSLRLEDKTLSETEYMLLKIRMAKAYDSDTVLLPPYSSAEVLKAAEGLTVRPLYEHKGNTMAAFLSFCDFSLLCEYEPTFFAAALSAYLSRGGELPESDLRIIRYEFTSPDPAGVIARLNPDKQDRITLVRDSLPIRILPKNDGFRFTAYATVSGREEYGEEFLSEAVKDALGSK